jgi:extradiol dioxygenase family protein
VALLQPEYGRQIVIHHHPLVVKYEAKALRAHQALLGNPHVTLLLCSTTWKAVLKRSVTEKVEIPGNDEIHLLCERIEFGTKMERGHCGTITTYYRTNHHSRYQS